jgi:hypothetical protein
MGQTSIDGVVTDHSTDPTHMNARLWDFNIDGATLKSEHWKWLDAAIKRINTSNRSLIWNISVTGAASLTGIWIDDNRHNNALGVNRAREVTNYLKSRLSVPRVVFNPPFSASTMFAELAKHKIGVENDEDRCAFVVITTDTIPPPIPPRPTSIPLSREWAIKYVWGDSVTKFIGIEAALYDIADTSNRIHAFFEYSADVVSGSVFNIPLSITGEGDWKRFSTTIAIHVSDFDGPARFSSGGVGPFSKNALTMTPKAGMTIPTPVDIPTGTTWGSPGGSEAIPGTGWLRLKSPRPISYSGLFPP